MLPIVLSKNVCSSGMVCPSCLTCLRQSKTLHGICASPCKDSILFLTIARHCTHILHDISAVAEEHLFACAGLLLTTLAELATAVPPVSGLDAMVQCTTLLLEQLCALTEAATARAAAKALHELPLTAVVACTRIKAAKGVGHVLQHC